MANDFSFDIVSKPDINEVHNAVNIATKEIINRFDFKGTESKINFTENELELDGVSDLGVRNIFSVFEKALIKRDVPIGFFDQQPIEDSLGGRFKQKLIIKQGISIEKAKEITKKIKESGLKAKTNIQDNQIRVSSAKKDVLQEVIQLVKGSNFGIVLRFTNYR